MKKLLKIVYLFAFTPIYVNIFVTVVFRGFPLHDYIHILLFLVPLVSGILLCFDKVLGSFTGMMLAFYFIVSGYSTNTPLGYVIGFSLLVFYVISFLVILIKRKKRW